METTSCYHRTEEGTAKPDYRVAFQVNRAWKNCKIISLNDQT